MADTTDLLIGDIFRRNAATVPNAGAASLGSRDFTHGELNAAGNRLAWTLRDLGIGRGDRVVTWSDTSLEVLPLFVALAKLGAVLAPLNARLGADEAADFIRLASPRMLVADAAHANDAATVCAAFDVELVGHLGDCSGLGTDLAAAAHDVKNGNDAEVYCAALRDRDPHIVFFTSGSTGRPKGVVISHRASYLRTFQGVFRDRPERTVCMFPLFHMAAFTLAMSAWQTRGEIALVASASAEEILETVARRRGNRLYCVPAVWTRILEADGSRWDTSSLRELDTGTSATPVELLRVLKERFPDTSTRVYYGSTEVGSATALGDADVLRKPGSVGLPSPGVDIKIAEGDEICVRSAYLMDRYLDDPEATAAAIRDGWFHSGDVGVLDDEGYLSIVGRLKDLIRTGGESVAPVEIEAVLTDHAGIAEVAVVGIPDAQWGEIVCAVVVAKSGQQPSLDDLQQHCQGRLAGFKKPRRLELVEALPRTAATGQVQRLRLIEDIVSGVTRSASDEAAKS